MATRDLPVPIADSAHYICTVVLDGVSYTLHYDLNARDEFWYLNIHDSADVPIEGCISRKLVTNWPTLNRATHPDKPPGTMVTISGDHIDPGFEDLGKRVLINYVDALNG